MRGTPKASVSPLCGSMSLGYFDCETLRFLELLQAQEEAEMTQEAEQEGLIQVLILKNGRGCTRVHSSALGCTWMHLDALVQHCLKQALFSQVERLTKRFALLRFRIVPPFVRILR